MPIKIELADITAADSATAGDKALILSGMNARLLDLTQFPGGVGGIRFYDEVGNAYSVSVVTVDGGTKILSQPQPV